MKTQLKAFSRKITNSPGVKTGGSQKQISFLGWYSMYVSGETLIALKPLFSKSTPKYKSPLCL